MARPRPRPRRHLLLGGLGLLVLHLAGSGPAPAAAQEPALSPSRPARPDSVHSSSQDSVRAQEPPAWDRGLGRTLLSGATVVTDSLAATGGTVDAVKWQAKRRQIELNGVPYGITGLPVIYYSPSNGWSYGARVQIADYRRRPYRYKVTLHWVESDEGKRNIHVRLKVPHISGTGFGVVAMASDRIDPRARYYGLSNDSVYDKDLVTPGNPDFIDEDYYHYILEEPRVFISLLRHVYGPVTMSLDLGVERTNVDPAGQHSYYIEAGTPDGVVDGITGFVGTSLSWDTRDDPTIPKRGVFHEWSYETSRNSLLGLLFEEIDFQRYTFTDARYWPRTARLNIAHRTIVEALKGSVPLYAYGEIGGSQRAKGVGGADNLRGYDRQRFTDNVRVLTNTEARYHLGSRVVYKQYLELHGVVFIDTGQVAPGFSDLRVRNTHVTAGWGLRIYWNADFVIRGDLGVSAEQIHASVKLRNVF